MNTLLLVVITSLGYILAYRLYGRFVGRKLFEAANKNKMPAHEFEDGIDYIPTKKHIILGHHFTTIAGTGPIVGPAIGIIWGWVPAILWIFFGCIFMGAVHDFSALIISARHRGESVGNLAGYVIHPTLKYAFHVMVQFLLWLILAIFAMIMGILFVKYPQSVFPVWMEIPIAIWLGYQIRKGKNDLIYSIIAVVLMYVTIVVGLYIPIEIPALFGSPIVTWAILLFVYVYIASILPVNVLLQPRDYINSHELIIAMVLLVIGVIVGHPAITAPTFNPAVSKVGSDIPNIMPFLFITIACGAISGFHSICASGTTVKQVDKEEDTVTIGYGGMLLEGLLATLVIVAVAGGLGMGLEVEGTMFKGVDAFNKHYATWAGAKGLGPKIEAVVTGAANLMSSYGIPKDLGMSIMAVFIVSFAGTSLDSATRMQRYSLQELFRNKEGKIVKPFNNRFVATLIVVILAGILAFLRPEGKGALILWPLFGALNQLLASLVLIIATVYLVKKGKSALYTLIPAVFMMFVTVWAMIINIKQYMSNGDVLLTVIAFIVLFISAWLLIGALLSINKYIKDKKQEKSSGVSA